MDLPPAIMRVPEPVPADPPKRDASVMIEKFAPSSGSVPSEFLDLNHTSKSMILVSLIIPKFAPEPSREHRRNSESGH